MQDDRTGAVRLIGERARERVGGRVALQGNIDPSVLFAPPSAIRIEARAVLDSFGNHPGHVFNLGHGISQFTPPENVALEAVFSLSPDSRKLAFKAAGRLWVHSLESGESRDLTAAEGVPFWSPDSRFVGYPSQGKLKKIEATGGPKDDAGVDGHNDAAGNVSHNGS